MYVVGGIAVQHAVLCDQASGAFGQKDFVTKLDRFLYLAAFDQIGVGFED